MEYLIVIPLCIFLYAVFVPITYKLFEIVFPNKNDISEARMFCTILWPLAFYFLVGVLFGKFILDKLKSAYYFFKKPREEQYTSNSTPYRT